MSQSYLLEGVNGNFLVFSLAACLIFVHYIKANFKEGYLFLRPAIALLAVFGGEVIIRWNFWWTRHQVNAGWDTTPSVWLTIIGSALASWGILCTIYVFAPTKWRLQASILTVWTTLCFLFFTLTHWI